MVKIIDSREERKIHFSEISKGQVFWSTTYLCFMLKVEEWGCDECNGPVNAVDLSTGDIYEVEPTEAIEPCHAEIKLFN